MRSPTFWMSTGMENLHQQLWKKLKKWFQLCKNTSWNKTTNYRLPQVWVLNNRSHMTDACSHYKLVCVNDSRYLLVLLEFSGGLFFSDRSVSWFIIKRTDVIPCAKWEWAIKLQNITLWIELIPGSRGTKIVSRESWSPWDKVYYIEPDFDLDVCSTSLYFLVHLCMVLINWSNLCRSGLDGGWDLN